MVGEIRESSLGNRPLHIKLSFSDYSIHGEMIQSFLHFFLFFVHNLINHFLAALLPSKEKMAFENDP